LQPITARNNTAIVAYLVSLARRSTPSWSCRRPFSCHTRQAMSLSSFVTTFGEFIRCTLYLRNARGSANPDVSLQVAQTTRRLSLRRLGLLRGKYGGNLS